MNPLNEKPEAKPLVANQLADIIHWGQAKILFFGTTDVWFRGHAKAHWKLVPAVHRTFDYTYERNVNSRFVRRAKTRHGNCPSSDDLAGWLFLMQHYRLPTRLLDWSESVLVATYFAVLEYDDEPAVVWCMKPTLLNKSQTGEESILEVRHTAADQLFGRAFSSRVAEVDKVVAVVPAETDPRMMVQQAAPTIHGTTTPIEDIPGSEKFLFKFYVPAKAKKRIRHELDFLGIRKSYLFPDLEHLAEDLASMSFT